MTLDAWRPQHVIHVGRDARTQGAQPLFFLLRTWLAILRHGPRSGLSLGAETAVLDSVGSSVS